MVDSNRIVITLLKEHPTTQVAYAHCFQETPIRYEPNPL